MDVSYAIAATKEDPKQPAHRLSLADIATKLGNYSLAEKELHTAGKLDKLGEYQKKIASMRQDLEKRRTEAAKRKRHAEDSQSRNKTASVQTK
jgi:hypothetical protein